MYVPQYASFVFLVAVTIFIPFMIMITLMFYVDHIFFFFLIELKLQCAVFPIMLGPVAVIVSLKGMGNMVPVSKQSLSALENVLCVKHTDSGSMTHRIVIVTSATSCLSWFCF